MKFTGVGIQPGLELPLWIWLGVYEEGAHGFSMLEGRAAPDLSILSTGRHPHALGSPSRFRRGREYQASFPDSAHWPLSLGVFPS